MAPTTPRSSSALSSLELDLAANPPTSPFDSTYLLRREVPASTQPYEPGHGSFDPHKIDNRGFFALFALLGVAFVLVAIWFFFWAKNGGFVWRKNDWDDYKSTVLRRKGPNGTTLSGATKTTALGGGSVVADGDGDTEWDDDGGTVYSEKPRGIAGKVKAKAQKKKSKQPRGSKNNHDNDMRAYRTEKPARVGGLNKEADGSYHHDFASATDPSETASHNYRHTSSPFRASKPTPVTPKKKSDFYTHSPASNSSQRPLRPNAQAPASGHSTPTRSRQASPRKHQSRMSGAYTDPIDFGSRYSGSRVAESDAGFSEDSRGTKAYFHPIPGLGAGAGSAGHGYRGGGGGYGGFRRGRGRRDSLSDSDEGETVRS